MADYQTISVIIPVHNGSKFLSECLDSVIGQTYKKLEIICVNDDSTDNTQEILEYYKTKDDRIRLFKIDACNVGVKTNFGLSKSSGELIAFIDADDWVSDDYFEALFKGIKNADIAVCNYCRIENNKETFSNYPIEKLSQIDFLKKIIMDDKYHNYLWHKLYTRKTVPNGIVAETTYHHDLNTLYKIILNADKINIIADGTYYYRIHDGGISHIITPMKDIQMFLGEIERYHIVHQKYPELNTELMYGFLTVLDYFFTEISKSNDEEIMKIDINSYNTMKDFVKEHYDDIIRCKYKKSIKDVLPLLNYEPHELKNKKAECKVKYERPVDNILEKIRTTFNALYDKINQRN